MGLVPLPTKKVTRAAPNLDYDILYVEDDDANWEIAEFALRSKYRLTRAASSQEAFRLLSDKAFDLILMDIELKQSDLNGIRIAEILKGKHADDAPLYAKGLNLPIKAPIVFVTAYTARYSPSELKKLAGDDCVAKPVNLTALNLVITRWLVHSMA